MRNLNDCPEIYPQKVLKGETIQVQNNGHELQKISLLNKNGIFVRVIEGETLKTNTLNSGEYMIRMDTKDWIYISKVLVSEVHSKVINL